MQVIKFTVLLSMSMFVAANSWASMSRSQVADVIRASAKGAYQEKKSPLVKVGGVDDYYLLQFFDRHEHGDWSKVKVCPVIKQEDVYRLAPGNEQSLKSLLTSKDDFSLEKVKGTLNKKDLLIGGGAVAVSALSIYLAVNCMRQYIRRKKAINWYYSLKDEERQRAALRYEGRAHATVLRQNRVVDGFIGSCVMTLISGFIAYLAFQAAPNSGAHDILPCGQ